MFLDVFDDELLEGGGVTGAVVFNTVLVVLGEELDGGETFKTDLLGDTTFSIGVNFSDDDTLGGEVGVVTELSPGGSHANTVATPRGVELDEDVLGGVTDNLVVVGASELDDFSGDDGQSEDSDESDDELEHVLQKVFFLEERFLKERC